MEFLKRTPEFARMRWLLLSFRTILCRGLAYFVPVIEEVSIPRVSPDYFQYLRQKIARRAPTR